jgi:hypothetical protein
MSTNNETPKDLISTREDLIQNSNKNVDENTQTKVNDVVTIVDEKVSKYDLVKLFSDLISTNDKLNELKTKLSFPIDAKVLNLIKLLVEKTPESLKHIQTSFEEIIADGKLDASDIPKVVFMVSNLYRTNLKQVFVNLNLQISDLLDLIKFIVQSVIELDIVPVDNKQKIIQVLDISLALLDTIVELPSVKEVGNLFSSCFGCIGKK